MGTEQLLHHIFRIARRYILIGAACALTGTQALAQAPTPATPWPAVVVAAKKEGTVFFYGSMAVPVLQRLADGFRKAYPDIKVEFTRMNGGPIIQRADQERTTGTDGADLIIGSEIAWMVERARQGLFHKPMGPALANWPSNFIFENGSYIAGAYEPWVLAYNTKLVSTPPRSYQDLLKPEFKDKLGIPQIPSTLILSWYAWLEQSQGADYPTRIMAQNPKVFISSPPLAQAIAAGEISASLLNNPSSIKTLMNSGAPINYTVPSPAYGFQLLVGALSWSKRPNAALVFIDWLMSREGQTVWSGTGESASPLKGIPGAAEVSSDIKFYNYTEWTPEVVKQYTEKWNRQYKR
jgi:iron(III) transport system substrate-binding protein